METMGAHVRQGKARTSKKMAMLARKRPSWSQIAAPVKGRWGRRAIVQISKDTSCALCCAGKTQLCWQNSMMLANSTQFCAGKTQR